MVTKLHQLVNNIILIYLPFALPIKKVTYFLLRSAVKNNRKKVRTLPKNIVSEYHEGFECENQQLVRYSW